MWSTKTPSSLAFVSTVIRKLICPCCAELQPPSLEVGIDVQSGGIQNGVGPPRNLDLIVFFPQRIGDEQRQMDRVDLIDRIKVKINGAVSVVQAIALLSIHLRAGTTHDPEYIAVGRPLRFVCFRYQADHPSWSTSA